MKHKQLPIGTDDFKKLIKNGCYYVDKSLWIKDLLDRKSEVSLFTRPRQMCIRDSAYTVTRFPQMVIFFLYLYFFMTFLSQDAIPSD